MDLKDSIKAILTGIIFYYNRYKNNIKITHAKRQEIEFCYKNTDLPTIFDIKSYKNELKAQKIIASCVFLYHEQIVHNELILLIINNIRYLTGNIQLTTQP